METTITETVINSFVTPNGVSRTLSVEINNNNIDIDFSVKKENNEVFKTINLNRREALTLVYYLVRVLLPHKLLITKKEKK